MKLKKVTLLPYMVEYPSLGGSSGPSMLIYAADREAAIKAGEEYAYLFLDEPRDPESPLVVDVKETTLDIR